MSVAVSSTRSECSCSVLALHGASRLPVFVFGGRLPAPGLLFTSTALLTPAGSLPRGHPQVRTRCVPARPPHLPPRLEPRLRCVVPARRIAPAFLCGSCPSARGFPASSRRSLPSRRWLQVVVSFTFSRAVLLQGDLHPIYNAPMLGAHHRRHPTLLRAAGAPKRWVRLYLRAAIELAILALAVCAPGPWRLQIPPLLPDQ